MAKYIRSTYSRLPIFYGDDGRRIKTIYVSNIRERTTVENLVNKYSIYGPVQSCILKCHVDSDERYAIVTMDYAYDASKILRDYPDDAKHLYSLIPKRMTKIITTTKSSHILAKKEEIVRTKNRIEAPLLHVKRSVCTQPSVAMITYNDDGVQKPQPAIDNIPATVSCIRHRVVKPKSLKVRAQTTEKKCRIETKPEMVSEKVNIESSTNGTITAASVAEDIEKNPFISLNDDCLISVFSFCDKLDLVNLAMVCEQFRYIVHNYLKAKITKIVDLNKIKSSGKITVSEARKFLKFIEAAQNTQQLELTMSGFREHNDEHILDETLKFCGQNLHCLKFNGFSFMESFTSQWKHLLNGLTTLILHQCILCANMFSALLKLCANLEVLNVTNSRSCELSDDEIKTKITEFKCIKLKEFRLASSQHCGNSIELIWLLENNPNLSVLQISDIGDSIKLTGEILQSICRFHQLQDLAFSFQNFVCNLLTNLYHLTRLKELKSLSLQCDWTNISAFIRQLARVANKQIECLSFECIDIDTSFMKSMGRFRKLKYLKLENTIVTEPSQEVFEQSIMDLTYRLNSLSSFHCQLHLFTEDTLIQFVERMKKLEHFQISGLVMNLLLFMRIVTACGRRSNGIKLNIVIDDYQQLNEYLDLIRSEYGSIIGIKSRYD